MYKLIINFKTYSQSTGKEFYKLLKACEESQKDALKKNVQLIIAPQHFNLNDKTSLSVYAQHADPFTQGSHTGAIIPENLKEIGVSGSILNHSEKREAKDLIIGTLEELKKNKLQSCLCVKDSKEVKEYVKYKPTYIAVEPPELIGGDISISTAQPELIKESVKAAENIPLLVGAGVKTAQDVKVAIKLGAQGILVASGVVKAKNPKRAIRELLDGF